jgi:hypothetical protein
MVNPGRQIQKTCEREEVGVVEAARVGGEVGEQG